MKGLSHRRAEMDRVPPGAKWEEPCPRVVPDESSGRLVPTNTKLKEQYQ